MQLSELQLQRRKASVPKFTNHTLRPWEITSPSQSPLAVVVAADGCGPDPLFRPDMFGGRPTPSGMTIGRGPLSESSTSTMGQAPSRQEQHHRSNANTILREDSIVRHVEERSYADDFDDEPAASTGYSLPPLSREDSWSIHYDCTNQAPYSTTLASNDSMLTQNSILHLPRGNDSRDLALFLRTTGPVAPQRRPSKIEAEPPRRAVSAPKQALRFLKLGGSNGKRQVTPVRNADERLNGMLRDEGGLLANAGPRTPQTIPKGYEQKVSSTGKPYLALQLPSKLDVGGTGEDTPSHRNILEPEVLESRVSVCFHEESSTSDFLDNYLSSLSKEQSMSSGQHDTEAGGERPATSYEEVASRLTRRCPTPIRPAASNPPSPVPDSAISRTESYRSGCFGPATARPSVETTRSAFTYPPRTEEPQTPKISLPKEEFPVKHPSPEKEVEIKHPLPRRLGSHPVLLQRASSLASTLYPSRSVSDSPGPPPPRSPLRPRKDPRSIESMISTDTSDRRMTPRTAPSIKSATDFDFGMEPIRAIVTTECSGPIKRPKSRDKQGNSPKRLPYPINRKQREDRLRATRKRPIVDRTIDSVVHAPANATRQKLKKIRPQIQIPDLRPPPLRAPSAASSVSSWQKVTQSTLTPVSPVPSEATDIDHGEEDKTGYTPISPTASAEAKAMQAGMGLSPVMLVAEEVPVPKTKSPPKPARLILKEPKSKPYAPRPRSASMSRTALKRRSKSSVHSTSLHSSPRGKSPVYGGHEKEPPPLPSPPPTRALPPTPPASGSERARKANSKAKVVAYESSNNRKTRLSPLPSHEVSPIDTNFSKSEHSRLPHVVTQQQQRSKYASSSKSMASRISARLEALEKQNALLSAALMAVLQTNGSLNGPLPMPESPVSKGPMAWESRVARRSAATSHTASSSNGSALEMYMSTRRGSRGYS